MEGLRLARCMGGHRCHHIKGTCTATACSKHGLLQPDGKCAMCELDRAMSAPAPELVEETDTIVVFKEKFASSLESMADDLDGAREVFAADHDIVGAFLATASWLRRSGKAIRDSEAL